MLILSLRMLDVITMRLLRITLRNLRLLNISFALFLSVQILNDPCDLCPRSENIN
jgi:hypothetical protein